MENSPVENSPVENSPVENRLEQEVVLPQPLDCWQQTLHWQPSPVQQQQFQRLYTQVLQGNRQLNLTRITQPEEFWEKHLWDSLSGIKPWLGEGNEQEVESASASASAMMPAHSVPSDCKAIDIGTGAGFPGIPIAIVQPAWTVTLLDSTRKKMAFVEGLLAELGLQNCRTVSDRVEQVAHQPQHRQAYDLVTLRAVASAAACAEYALPLLKVGGIAVLYRGQWAEEEAIGLQAALALLGGRVLAVEAFRTPLSSGERHCLYIQKEKLTAPEFPRAIGVVTRVPLG
ncbi:16S rRNA (guanine(527)-N(7))-methyltransferase RsmG [Phormidium tenue FACHB-886]|nr:16S rRNA (guanine(527)-N(7))-methyltransferase RsmG [Phormidium tenue FACHB-886]